jgi:hypothetical protein
VAEAGTGMKIPPPGPGEVRQSPAIVARKMCDAIRKPRAEVWPLAPARFALSLATLFPAAADRIMAKYRGQLDEQST